MNFSRGYEGLEKVLVGLLALLIADTIVGGPIGLFFRGERHLILALIVIVAGYLGFSRWHECRTLTVGGGRNFLWPLVFFLVSLIWILLVPMYVTGNVGMALRDAQSLILLPIASLLLYAITDLKSAIRRLLKVVVILSVCLAIFQLVFWFWLELKPTPTNVYYPILEAIFNTTQSMFVGWHHSPSGGYVRVVWVSSIWLVAAVFVAPLVMGKKWLLMVELILGAAIYISYTRGIWLGVATGVLFCTVANYIGLVFKKRNTSPIKNWVIVLLGLFFATIVISSVDFAVRGQFGFLSRMVDFSPDASGVSASGVNLVVDESISERSNQAILLMKMWRDRPLMGGGYGAYMPDHFSDEHAPYSYEMLPFALLMKLGMVGFALYLLFWARMIVYALRRDNTDHNILFAGGLTAFLLAAHTNPLLFNFVGMSVVLFFLLWWVPRIQE